SPQTILARQLFLDCSKNSPGNPGQFAPEWIDINHCGLSICNEKRKENRNCLCSSVHYWFAPPKEVVTMTQPVPERIDPSRLVELALAVIKADRFPYLASMDGDQPRLRPVSPGR